jgi:cytochrome P450
MTSATLTDAPRPVLPADAPDPPTLNPLQCLRFLYDGRRDMIPALDTLFAHAGPIGRIRAPAGDLVFIARADEAHRVFFLEQDRYPKGQEYDIPALGLRSGLVTSRGEEWKRDRAMLNPLFSKRHLEPLAGTMGACTETLLERWEAEVRDGGRLDLAHEMMRVTLDIAARTLFGSRLAEADVAKFGTGIEETLKLMLSVGNSPVTWALAALPGVDVRCATRAHPRRVRRIDHWLAEVDALISRLIAARRVDASAPKDDFLGLMLSARDGERGEPMSHQKLLDQCTTFLGAGHETTASALSWTFHLLAEHPQARARMLAEVDEVLGGRAPEFADIDRLPWTKACFSEAMRLRPPVYLSMRRAQEDDVLGGYRVRANSIVILLTHLLHRDPALWPEPERYDPERFLPGAGKDRPRAAYLPFGSGRRVCIGSQFATIEAVLILAQISQRYVLDSAPGWTVRQEGHTTLRPKGGLPMILRARA